MRALSKIFIVLISIEIHVLCLVLFYLYAERSVPRPVARCATESMQEVMIGEKWPGLAEPSLYVRTLFGKFSCVTLRIPSEDYFKYRFGKSHRPQGFHVRDYAVFATPHDPHVVTLARELCAMGLPEEHVATLVDLVQRIGYEYDRKNKGQEIDFVRHPLETLVENCGDCEDMAILAASLIAAAGHEVVLVKVSPTHESLLKALEEGKEEPAGHMLIGVPGAKGRTIKHKGKSYTLVETTGVVPIGNIATCWTGLDFKNATVALVGPYGP